MDNLKILANNKVNRRQYNEKINKFLREMKSNEIDYFDVVGRRYFKDTCLSTSVEKKYSIDEISKVLKTNKAKIIIKEDSRGRTYFLLKHRTSEDFLEIRPMPKNYKGKTKNLRMSEIIKG